MIHPTDLVEGPPTPSTVGAEVRNGAHGSPALQRADWASSAFPVEVPGDCKALAPRRSARVRSIVRATARGLGVIREHCPAHRGVAGVIAHPGTSAVVLVFGAADTLQQAAPGVCAWCRGGQGLPQRCASGASPGDCPRPPAAGYAGQQLGALATVPQVQGTPGCPRPSQAALPCTIQPWSHPARPLAVAGARLPWALGMSSAFPLPRAALPSAHPASLCRAAFLHVVRMSS